MKLENQIQYCGDTREAPVTAGSPKFFSGSPLVTDAPKCSEKVLEESITLCGPKDSGEVVWSSGSRCRGYSRALQLSMIRCCGVQSYTGDGCTSKVARGHS